MDYRVKCPHCGTMNDLKVDGNCSYCEKPINIPKEGMIQLYRQGSFIGMAVGYNIYLNDKPMGTLANKKSVKIPVNFGTYKLHLTCGMTEKCEDITFDITPEQPNIYLKGRIKAGFWSNKIIIEKATLESMPEE